MMILFDILLCAVFLLAGYIGACCYLNSIKIKELKLRDLKLTRNRIIYLIIGVAACATLIAFFHTMYSMEIQERFRLLILVLTILPAAAIDSRLQKLPNIFLLAGLAMRVVLVLVDFLIDPKNGWMILKDSLIGAVVIGLFFLFLLVVFKNSIGMGDVKLFALMGLYQGLWGVINSVFFSLVTSFFISVALLITRKKGRKDTISFGPSICLGTIIAMCLAGM